MTDDVHDDIETLAAEFVIGVLDAEEHARVEARLRSDPLLRAAVARASTRFHPLDLTATPAALPVGMWHRIEERLSSADGGARVVDMNSARPSAVPRTARRGRPATAARGAFWRGFAAASLLAVAAGGIALQTLRPHTPRLVVVLLDASAQPVSIVEALGDRRIRVLPLGDIAVPEGKTLQVWTLPNKQMGPVSMGLLPRVGATTLDGPPLPQPRVDQLYEITIEPAGGSPTGKPTGPIVGKGFARAPQI